MTGSSLREMPVHDQVANTIRGLSMDAVQRANSGHPGAPMGMADVATVLITRFLKVCPTRPDWPDRDRMWRLTEKYGVSIFYTAPTAIRAFMKWGEEFPGRCDLGRLRLLGHSDRFICLLGEAVQPFNQYCLRPSLPFRICTSIFTCHFDALKQLFLGHLVV